MTIVVPEGLRASCAGSKEATRWLTELPELVAKWSRRWGVTVGEPFEAAASWVAPAEREGDASFVFKAGMPHMEGRDEIAGLRFWAGTPTVRLVEADEGANVMLLERCRPGDPLRLRPETEQDVVIAKLLRSIWIPPSPGLTVRPLSRMLDLWEAEARASDRAPSDGGLFEAGTTVFRTLSRDDSARLLLATDLHAGNVLAAERSPWLVIDPKPFVGDPAYDVTQHLLNCAERLHADPIGLTRNLAERTGQDPDRVRAWTFARIAVHPWSDDERWTSTARSLDPS